MSEYEVSLTFSNEREAATSFILEPWGEIYRMEPHTKLTVCFCSLIPPSSPHTVEVEYGVNQITVYAWEGCTAALFQNGEELGTDIESRPRVPQGLETLKSMGFFHATMNDVLVEERQKDSR
ncbi:hypothetical protein [Dictyobacter kobayashii]|uniref:Uncharacterized protein n=1 Tax=Dictyobacter kobayashii TaxID=2014872 RepID=A0A402APD0_9CHLR|nr:hypothetical protein [Dictyobacter kobayashii]GCE20904.1 hypothetical protein KDK_47040 [Dictyobacter kobayashii]